MHDFSKCLFVCVTLFASQCAIGQQNASVSDAKNSASYFQCPVANAESLLRGDVLIKIDETFDGTKELKGSLTGVIRFRETYLRLTFDHPAKMYRYVNLSKFQIVDYDHQGNPKKSELVYLSGTSSAGNKGIYRYIDGQDPDRHERSSYPKNEVAFLKKIGFFDVRSFWISNLGTPIGFRNGERGQDDWRCSGKSFHKQENVGKNLIDFWLKGRPARSTDGSMVENFEITRFDTESLMPIVTRSEVVDANGKRMIAQERKMRWKEQNSVFVPILGSKTNNSQEYINEKFRVGEVFSDFRFHWFKVNEQVDEKLFSKEILKSKQALLDEVSVIKTNAKSIKK